jgi:hypothetical protein
VELEGAEEGGVAKLDSELVAHDERMSVERDADEAGGEGGAGGGEEGANLDSELVDHDGRMSVERDADEAGGVTKR